MGEVGLRQEGMLPGEDGQASVGPTGLKSARSRVVFSNATACPFCAVHVVLGFFFFPLQNFTIKTNL